jgi:hypothetical protein
MNNLTLIAKKQNPGRCRDQIRAGEEKRAKNSVARFLLNFDLQHVLQKTLN